MNRLENSLSPYLRQHAGNPVDWWEWGPDAFAEAQRRDVPILLSVGYAACHWCHVMAHESFENEATAALMNDGFVNVKVDREERPDIDAIYMAALQALTGQGGWPMTVFLTPDRAPFHAGTYFPPTPMHQLPSFAQVLAAVSDAWHGRRADLATQSEALVAHLRTAAEAGATPVGDDASSSDTPLPPTTAVLASAVDALALDFDSRHGGFGGAPKFPPAMTLEQLLRHHARTGSDRARSMVARTCEAMARGGIYDQLGGGFARYSVDNAWVVPHFEKMLYDNAQLLGVYARLWRVEPAPWVRRVALETAEFLLRELRTANGAFAASLDADTEGVEGLFYAWTPAQLAEVLGPDDSAWAAGFLLVTPEGTFDDGMSTLQLPIDPDTTTAERWTRVRAALVAARSQRTAPARDDKVIAGWNGLVIGALVDAGMILDHPDLVAAARAAAEAVVDLHWTGTVLHRVSLDSQLSDAPGTLEDYGLLADALLILFSATGEERWYRTAQDLLDVALDQFVEGTAGVEDTGGVGGVDIPAGSVRFYDVPRTGPSLILRPADPGDNASPSGRSAIAGALLRFAALSGSARHRVAAEAALSIYPVLAEAAPRFAGWGLAVSEALADGPREVAIIVPELLEPTVATDNALVRAAWRATPPGLVIAVGTGQAPPESPESPQSPDAPGEPPVPLLADRPLRNGVSTAYVCQGFVCQRPVTEVSDLAELLT